MKKRNIILIACLIILIILGTILFENFKDKNNNVDDNKENQIKENKNLGVVSKKSVSNLVFDNIKYIYDGEYTIVYMEITNNNDKGVYLREFVVKVYDKNNELLGEFNPNPDYLIESGKTNDLEFFTKRDLSSAFRMEIELPQLEYNEE